MNLKITLKQMKDLSIDDILRLYKMGYRIEDDSSFSMTPSAPQPVPSLAPIPLLTPQQVTIEYPVLTSQQVPVAHLADPLVDPYINFGKATVSTGYDDLATFITLNSGNGAIFPDPSVNGAFNLVWWNSTDYADPSDDPNKEIVRCTSRSGDILTLLRAQENTAASIKNLSGKTYKVALSITAKAFTDLQNDAQSRVDTHASLSAGTHGVTGNITGTSDIQSLTNKTITGPTNYVMANYLKSLTTAIDVSASSAPSTGQILMATSPTSATWQSLSAPNRTSFTAQVINAPITGTLLPNIPIPDGFSLVVRATVTNIGQIYIANSVANAISGTLPGNRNTLNAGDAVKLYVSNANTVAVAGSIPGITVDIIVEQ